jgi:hypothetical protein
LLLMPLQQSKSKTKTTFSFLCFAFWKKLKSYAAAFSESTRVEQRILSVKMSSALNEWRAIADYHTAGLAQAQAKIAELSAPAPAASAAPAAEKLLSRSAVHALVAKMGANDSKKDKAEWNILIARGMIENVQGILWECYAELRHKNSNDDGWKAARELGARDGTKWQQFGLRVIQKLKDERCFGIGSADGLNDFEDTAGGCDETTWNVACELLAADAAAVAVPAVAVPAVAVVE